MRPIVTDRVAWSVCHTSEPCKNGWTDRDAVWVEDSGEPREPCITWGPDSHGKGQVFGEKGRPIVKYRVGTVYTIVCAKTAEPIEMPFGLCDRMGPRNYKLWGPGPPIGMGNFWRKARPLCYRDFLPWAGQKRLNRSTCRLGCGLGLGWAEGSTSSIIFATWRIRLNRPSAAAMQPYVKLLWRLVIIITSAGIIVTLSR